MKPLLLLMLVGTTLACCNSPKHDDRKLLATKVDIPNMEVAMGDLVLHQTEGKWYWKNTPFNGYSVKFHPNGQLMERISFYQGKKEGVARQWSRNGVLRVEQFYQQNKLVKKYRSWWENGNLASEVSYVNGLRNGIAKEWYPNGQLAKERQLKAGKEDGLQKAWLQSGVLYVNYEAKHGRIYGMRRANSCYQLKNEVVVQSKR